MAGIRITCPGCGKRVAMSAGGRISKHGNPECTRSRKSVGRIWPTRHHGRRVQTVPGPDTWNSNTLEGTA